MQCLALEPSTFAFKHIISQTQELPPQLISNTNTRQIKHNSTQMLSVLVVTLVLHAASETIELAEKGVVDRLLPYASEDTVWSVQCDGVFRIHYQNWFEGVFIIARNGEEWDRTTGDNNRRSRPFEQTIVQGYVITLTARVSPSHHNKVLFSWACGATPALLPATMNTAGDVVHMNYEAGENVTWALPCDGKVDITWTYFDTEEGEDVVSIGSNGAVFNESGSSMPAPNTYYSSYFHWAYLTFTSETAREGGGFALRYHCLSTPVTPFEMSPPRNHERVPVSLIVSLFGGFVFGLVVVVAACVC